MGSAALADDRLEPTADLRVRSELERFDGEPDRWRLRLRARAGARYRPDSRTVVGLALSTGSASPTSSQLTLGDGFGRELLRLSEAYLGYAPADWIELRAGKVPNDLRHRRLVWDRDVRPEGATERLHLEPGDGAPSLELVAGQYVLAERADDRELYLLVGQIASALERGPIEAEVAFTYYAHPRARGDQAPYARGSNSVDADGGLSSDFEIAAALAQLAFANRVIEVGGYLEMARNLGADSARNAIATGIEAEPGAAPIELGYEYRRVGRDAILDSLAESSWYQQRTGFAGHKVRAALHLSPSWRLSSSLKLMEPRGLAGPRQVEWLLDVRWRYRP